MSSAPPEPGPEPSPSTKGATARRRRWIRAALVIFALAAITTVLVLDRRTLEGSLSHLGNLDPRWFLLAIVCEVGSLIAFGLSRRRLLRADGDRARFGSVMAITYAGNALSMSIPFAGAQLAAVFAYKQFRRRGLDPALTGWALGVSAIASSSALALLLVIGALAGGAALATAIGFLGAAVFALPAITVILALRYPKARALANHALTWVVHQVQRIFHRPGMDPAVLEELLERLASIRLSWTRYIEVWVLAVANWVLDCGCLACAIKATGQAVPWHGLLLAYGAGAVAGSTGVTPGGFLLVEAALTGALVGAGLNSGAALAAVLAYRLVNFWMILLGGGGVLVFLSRKRDSRIRPYPRVTGQPRAGSNGSGDQAAPGREAQSADHPG